MSHGIQIWGTTSQEVVTEARRGGPFKQGVHTPVPTPTTLLLPSTLLSLSFVLMLALSCSGSLYALLSKGKNQDPCGHLTSSIWPVALACVASLTPEALGIHF